MRRLHLTLGVCIATAAAVVSCGDSDDDAAGTTTGGSGHTGGGAGDAAGGNGGGSGHAGRGAGGFAGGAGGAGAMAGAAGAGDSGGAGGAATAGGGSGNDTAGGAGAGAAGLSGSGGAGGAAEGGAGGASTGIEPIQLNAPSFRVPAMSEVTQCVDVDLGNTASLHVGELHTTLGAGIFELRISAVSQVAANANLRPCVPFDDMMAADVKSLTYTKRPSDGMVFPSGVGYSFEPRQKLRFEIHAFNLSDGPIDTEVSATFVPMAQGAYQMEAGLLIMQNNKISLAPMASNVVSQVYFPAPAELSAGNTFALIGDTHKAGFSVTMATAPTSVGVRTLVYAPTWNWAEPEVVTFGSPLKVPAGGGIELGCRWNNPLQTAVIAGTSANDESCRALVYHYPAIPAHGCLATGNVSVCCPGSGC